MPFEMIELVDYLEALQCVVYERKIEKQGRQQKALV